MKILTPISIVLILVFTGCRQAGHQDFTPPEPKEWIRAENINVPVYDFSGIEPFLNRKNDTLYVVNFWASWCKPCVKEMPYFLSAERRYDGSPFRLYLISLDFRSEAEDELVPFMRKHNLGEQVMLLSDPDANEWIGRVHETWSGALPATLFYRNGKKYFHEGTLSEEELEEIIDQFI